MRGYLLDTNVLSELVKKRPSPAVLERLGSLPHESLATSSICVVELRYGAARRPDGEALWSRIAREVLPRVQILPLGFEEAEHAGDIRTALESRGESIGTADVLIGATALAHGLVVATRNLKHFDRIFGLITESWWEQESPELILPGATS